MFKDWDLKSFALFLSFAIGFIFPALFAWDIFQNNLQQKPNVPTWLMVLLLDVTGLVIAYVEGNKKPYLQLGWVLAAVLIVVAIFLRQGIWEITITEIASFVICIIAITLWLIAKNKKTIFGYDIKDKAALIGMTFQSVAIYVSFTPQAMDYWKTPDPSTWYLWFSSIVGCLLAVYGAKQRDIAHTFIPWACALLNAVILVLVFL